MTQNSTHQSWGLEDIDMMLRGTMGDIHQQCLNYGMEGQVVNYVKGANLAGFKKVADAMLAYGVI